MTALTAVTVWEHIKCVLQNHSHLMTESGRKSATTILCYRAATIKQSTSHERKSVICLFCLDCYFSDRVTGRVLEPVPAANRRRQFTALDKSESPIWVFGGFGTLLKGPGTLKTELPPMLVLLPQQFDHHISNINFNESSGVLNGRFCRLSLSYLFNIVRIWLK